MEYKEVSLSGLSRDPMVLDVIKSVVPSCLSNIGDPLFWSYVDRGYQIGISVFYGNCGTGTTIINDNQKKEFRLKLKELQRDHKINQIENEGLDKID